MRRYPQVVFSYRWQWHLGIFLCGILTASAADKIRVYHIPKERPLAVALDANHTHATGENPHALPAQPEVTYTVPAGWHDEGAGQMRVAGFSIRGASNQMAQVAITPLPGMDGREALIVNMWRQQVGMPELAEAEAAEQLKSVEVGGEPAKMFEINGQSASGAEMRIVTVMLHRGANSWFFKLQGDGELVEAEKPKFLQFLQSVKIEAAPSPELPAGHPPLIMPGAVTEQRPPKLRQGGPTWTIPAGWKEIDGGQFLFTKFIIVGEAGEQAAVNVSTSPGDGGGLVANVNRWRGQLGLSPWSDAEVERQARKIETSAGAATLIEMSGTDARPQKPTLTVAAIVPQNGATWFYKLMGDEKLVQAQKEAFAAFVKGVKY